MGHHDMPAWRASAQYALATASLMKTRIDARLTAAVGHSLAENEALANLRDAGEPIRMGEIAARLTLSPGGTTRLIDRLEEAGYVVRRQDPSDRRATTVEITVDGLAAVERARPIIVDAFWDLWGRHLAEGEDEVLLAVLAKVTEGNDWFE
jgi:DNA-binding MarR family transcriptional regulator